MTSALPGLYTGINRDARDGVMLAPLTWLKTPIFSFTGTEPFHR
jgi:hypothetical protein